MKIVEKFESRDGMTTKYLLESRGDIIEVVHVNRYRKHIICFTTTVGCPMGCGFCCATSFERRLSAAELFAECTAVLDQTDGGKPVLFSAMGEGDSFISEAAISNLSHAFDRLGKFGRCAVSTTMPLPDLFLEHIDTWSRDLKMQISLHAADDETRGELIPVAADLDAVIEAGMAYSAERPLEWNYVLIDGFNDRAEDAYRLSDRLGQGEFVKLNRLNPIPGSDFEPSSNTASFERILEAKGLETERYETDGVDISASCGQLKSNRQHQPDIQLDEADKKRLLRRSLG